MRRKARLRNSSRLSKAILRTSARSGSSGVRGEFGTIVQKAGRRFWIFGFPVCRAAEGIGHNRSLTRARTLRRGLEAIRRGAGEHAFILGCGCPLGPAVGIVDGMRIGTNVARFWGSSANAAGEPGTALAIDAILARNFMHRRWWLNDPDCLMLRVNETRLSNDEREALARTIAASGGMLLIPTTRARSTRRARDRFRRLRASASR